MTAAAQQDRARNAAQLATMGREQLEALYSRVVLKRLRGEVRARASRVRRPRPEVPDKLAFLFDRAPIKVARGGRGSGKSQSVARVLLWEMDDHYERVFCTRQFQSSIKNSVHQVLKEQINKLGMGADFEITDRSIKHRRTRGEFIYGGLQFHVEEVKSLEGITKTWVEEGHTLTKDGIDILLPTIFRDSGGRSELFITYNPEHEDAPVEGFVRDPMAGTVVSDVLTYRDNPWFPPGLEKLRSHAWELATAHGDYSGYDWIWEGRYRQVSEAVVFGRRVAFEDFPEPPRGTVFLHGLDYGFSNDPTALVRSFVTDNEDGSSDLWVDREAYGWGTPLDELPGLLAEVPTTRRWHIYADAARPETSHHLRSRGFDVTSAPKWSGSVEDGVEYLKGFRRIHVHASQCPNVAREFKLYSYKVDRNRIDPETAQPRVLPIIVDENNHGIDALRYGHSESIQGRGSWGISEELLTKLSAPEHATDAFRGDYG